MRTETEIQNRIRYLLTLELDQRVAESRTILPHKCRHNHRQLLDVRKMVEGEPNEQYNRLTGRHLPVIGFCMLGSDNPEEWNGTICEDPIDAQRCPDFTPIGTRESLREAFDSQLKDLEWVQQNMPEVYGLLWALGSENLPSLPWWKSLWFKFIRIRPDPIRPPSLPATEA